MSLLSHATVMLMSKWTSEYYNYYLFIPILVDATEHWFNDLPTTLSLCVSASVALAAPYDDPPMEDLSKYIQSLILHMSGLLLAQHGHW